jgi:hypothetical protein
MKLSLLASVVGFVVATGAAQAQIGIYITPVGVHVSNPTPDTGVFAFLGSGETSRTFAGVGFGFYDDFHHSGSIDAGIDIRDSIVRGAGAHLNSFLLGPRIAFKPTSAPVKPYLQAEIGVGTTRAATNPASLSRFLYNVAGGVDWTIAPHIDFRVIEIGYGSVQTISSGVFGDVNNPTNSQLINFSSGLVFRF